MTFYYDPMTEKLDEFLRREAVSVQQAVLARHPPSRPSLLSTPFLDSLNEREAPIKEALQELEQDIVSICERRRQMEFLLLFRRIPLMLLQYLAADLLPASSKDFAVSGVIQEAVLFGTNVILRYSPASSFESYTARYALDASESDFRDAYELSMLCFLHRRFMFRLNTLARRNLVEPISFVPLLDVYNQRLVRATQLKEADTFPALIFPAVFEGTDALGRPVSFQKKGGYERSIRLRNFFPILVDVEVQHERYAYLAGEEFFSETGVAFDSAWKIWIALNKVLRESIALLWPQEFWDIATDDLILPAIDRADDFMETCLGGGTRSSLIAELSRILEEAGEWDAMRDCHKLVDYLTFRAISRDVRFIEQPFVFYPLGENLFLWDYLRHGGFMKAIARTIGGRGAVGNLAGTYFEGVIERRICNSLAITGLKRNVELGRGRLGAWEIDVGFVVSDVLVLIEAKHEMKPLRYHFADGVGVSERVIEWEDRLAELDENLRLHRSELLNRWSAENPLGALCVICTLEVEFLASFNPTFWLDIGRVPRVLTLSELTEYLQTEAAELKDHPSFVSLG